MKLGTNTIQTTQAHANIDAFYGPYESIEIACERIPEKYRLQGLTIGIIDNGKIVEYQWKTNSISTLPEKKDADLLNEIQRALAAEQLIINTKLDTIADLSTIRSGAAAGATAQQPATTINGYGITDAYTKDEVDSAIESVDASADIAAEVQRATSAELANANVINSEISRATIKENQINSRVDDIENIIDDCVYIGENNGESIIADFDPQTDTLWKKNQVLSNAEKTIVKNNLGITQELVLMRNEIDTQNTIVSQLDGHTLKIVDTLPTDANPSETPDPDVIYRLVVVDGNDASYEDYMYDRDDLTTPIKIATYNIPDVAGVGYYECDSLGNSAAKTISANNYVLSTGGSMKVKMVNANTADNATLNINNTGAKPLYYDGERASSNNSWEAGETVEVYYDGTNFYANNVAGGSGSGDGAFDISAKTGNSYASLSDALTAANSILSAGKKKGGMSVKFVQSSDNKYVQYRLMHTLANASTAAADFANVANWQGVDDEPTAGSKNLVESGGIAISNLKKQNIGIDYEIKASDFTSGEQIHLAYGDVRAGTGKRCTEQYIPIPDGAKYIVLNKIGSTYSPLNELFNADTHVTSGQFSVDYCYYDSNKAFMPYNTNQPRVLGVGGGHIPTGAKYLRLNDSNDYTNGHLLTFYSSLPHYDNVVESNNVIHIQSNEWLVGYRFTDGGTLLGLQSSSQAVVNKLLNVNGVKQVQSNLRAVSMNETSAYKQNVFYDATGKVVLYTVRLVINDIPEEAVMMGCYDIHPNIPEDRDTYVRLFVESDNSDIQTEIERVTDAVMMPLARYNDNGVYSFVGGFYTLAPNEYLGSKPTYNEANSSAPSKTTGLIPVTIGDIFEYRGIRWGNNPSAILLALDENQAIIESIGDSINNNVNSGTYTVTSPFVKYIIYSTFIRDNLAPNSTLYLKWINRQVKYSIENSDSVMQGLVNQIEQLKAKLIAQDVNLDGIMPADYQISTEIAVANKKSKNLSSLISFAVFTDSHYKGANTGDTINTYPRLCNVIKYLYDKGQIHFAMALGDNIDTNNSDYYTEFKTMLGNTGCPYGMVVGNHDLLKPSVLRNGQYTIDGVIRGDSHNDTWYYFDIDDIRFIVLNGVDKKADDDADTQTRGMVYNGMSSYQIEWLIATLATDKKVVILSHYSLAEDRIKGGWSMTSSGDYEKALTIVEAFIDAESGSVTLDDESVISYDFSNQDNGIVLGVLCGHMHGDRIQFKNNKFNNIWLDNSLGYDTVMGAEYSQGDMALGTYTEVAMDIVTIDKITGNVYLSRIGRGGNREVINSSL